MSPWLPCTRRDACHRDSVCHDLGNGWIYDNLRQRLLFKTVRNRCINRIDLPRRRPSVETIRVGCSQRNYRCLNICLSMPSRCRGGENSSLLHQPTSWTHASNLRCEQMAIAAEGVPKVESFSNAEHTASNSLAGMLSIYSGLTTPGCLYLRVAGYQQKLK